MASERESVFQAKFIEAIDVSSTDYDAQTDHAGRPIPFTLLVGTGGDLDILPAENTSSVLAPVQDGYNPILCIQVKNNGSNTAVGTWALYSSKPTSVS
jgi:hypothetical protein